MNLELFKKVRTAWSASTKSSPHSESIVPGIPRHSNGLKELTQAWEKAGEQGEQRLRILDLGPTSRANISYITGLGHSLFNEDLLRAVPAALLQTTDSEMQEGFDADKFLRENLQLEPESFDAALLWDLPDYLPEPLVRPLVGRLELLLKPSGAILTYLHTRDAGPHAPFLHYHIQNRDTLELRVGPHLPLKRIYNNRHVEQLFRNFRSFKFFLARDGLREVLVIR